MNTSQWGPRVPSLMFEKRRLNVLLVDHEPNIHASIVAMLEHYFHKVTCVKYASTGLSILSRGSPKVDVVMENIKSPDLCGFKLLQDAVERDLHVILLLDEDDYVLTKMAVEAGALICITKPVTMGMTECLWQIVVGEKLRRIRRRNNLINNMNMNMNMNMHMNIQEQEQMSMEVTSYDMISDEETCSTDITSANSTKVWTEWTQELHDLFMDAVRKLGDGKCYPKDILELMNVPGLTRMQVASHLQKCRSGTWLPPNKRKPKVGDTTTTSVANSRRFGFMPRLATNPNNIHHTITNNVDVGVDAGAGPAGAGDQTIYIGSVGLTNWGVGVGVGVDGTLPPNEQLQLVVDHAQSAAPTTNASPLYQNDECFDEFPNIDSLIGGFCLFDEGPISYAVDDIDMVYSNLQVPVMSNADVDKWEEASEADNDAKTLTQVLIKKK